MVASGNRLFTYVGLLASTAVSVILLTMVIIAISGSREAGIGYGLMSGVVTGHFLLCLLAGYKTIGSIVKTILYSALLYGLFYFIADYLPSSWAVSVFLCFCLAIVAWELTFWITRKLMPKFFERA